MNMQQLEAAAKEVDLSTLPWYPTVSVGTCTKTGLPRVSVALRAPNTRDEKEHKGGLKVRARIKAGGIMWPAHSVVLASMTPSKHDVHMAVLESCDLAFKHELRENVSVRGKLLVDPHA